MSKLIIAQGIEILQCVWCGDYFVRIKTNRKPIVTCSDACRKDNRLFVRARVQRQYNKRKIASARNEST